MTTVFRIFAVACLLAGCAGLKTDYDIGRERAQAYVATHPELPSNTAEAIRSNTIHDGMTMDQFQQTVTVAGETQRAFGKACRQPDGSWRITS